MSKKNRLTDWKLWLGIALSVFGIWLAFRKFDGQEFLYWLGQTNLWMFALGMVAIVSSVILRAWRWQYLLVPIQRVKFRPLVAAEMICYFGNNVFPLRMGELLRSYSLSKSTGMSAVSVFGSVVAERFIDMITFFLLVIISAIIYPGMPKNVKITGLVALVAFVIMAIAAFFIMQNKDKIKHYFRNKTLPKSFDKITGMFLNFYKGFETLKSTPHSGMIFIISMIVWALCLLNVWLVGIALDTYFTFEQVLLIFFVTSAMVSIPAAPGYVGTYHAGAVSIMVYLGIGNSKAQAIAVIMHAVGFISLTLIGFFYFIHQHIKVSDTKIYEENELENKEI